MCSKLVQIYQKRTPTFLAQGALLVAVILLLLQPSDIKCQLQPVLNRFYWAILVTGALEIGLKLVVFSFLYWSNREAANSFNTVVLFLVGAVHLALWIYSIGLLGNQEMRVCSTRDRFFMKSYVLVCGALIVGGAVIFLVLTISAVAVTAAKFKRSRGQGDEEIEI